MKQDTATSFLVILGLALVAGALLAVWLIGGTFLRTLALIFVSGLTLALVIAACALPIRAWRRRDPTGETHYHHDGTRTVVKERVIDGRAVSAPQVKLLQLPAQPIGAPFPELLRAAYQAGMLGDRPVDQLQSQRAEDPINAQLQEIDPVDPEDWDGDIAP